MAQPVSFSPASWRISSNSPMVIDPYNLSLADQSGLIFVTQQLAEDNYHTWSHAMRKALNAKCKLRFITGSFPPPNSTTEPEKFENWQCVNDVECFQHGNGPRIFELKHELMNLHQGTMNIFQYFTRIKVLWEELNTHRPIQCNCGDTQAMREFLQYEYVHCFFMGLDKYFSWPNFAYGIPTSH
ncbi:uncharacterized protein LOC110269434 [Arachis ipaensis]|uniref:uncharacterized protein LOC110269434 n=1 Tax=Arachis ipaensis TaxID=130454 RepID=UPI000A2B66FA|nr:uncharacterized protein LOC110269434 [Arachis ipaensis]XP_025638405.1 uncharacterized protein LOC112733604 [Arachis hypogaea]